MVDSGDVWGCRAFVLLAGRYRRLLPASSECPNREAQGQVWGFFMVSALVAHAGADYGDDGRIVAPSDTYTRSSSRERVARIGSARLAGHVDFDTSGTCAERYGCRMLEGPREAMKRDSRMLAA
jgi:hypothetical protein